MTKAEHGKRGTAARARSRGVFERPSGVASDERIRYVETSALVAAALEGDVMARRSLQAPGRVITSALTHAEAARAVVRARAAGRLSRNTEQEAVQLIERFAEGCETVSVGVQTLARVGRLFPVEPVRTLDAIHLATIELLGLEPEAVTVVTRDSRIRANARAMGWSTE